MKYLFLLAGCLVLPFASPAQTIDLPAQDCCRSKYPRNHLDAFPTAALGQEYRRLKRAKCATCNFYGSDFFQLLKVLGVRLNAASVADIKRVLGPPDAVKGPVLVYYWRGEHDYLRFTPTAAGAVSSWYYALE
ncbi:MAG: hypothetical protein JWP58_4500 [Hymenobacter sp.]|nr:hypothetical protein [Hymenobacter sp.]